MLFQRKIRLHFVRNSGILDSDVLEDSSAMNLALVSAIGMVVFAGIGFVFVFRALASGNRNEALPGDWDSIFAPSRYKPMERLLDPVDHEFLAAQPSCNRRMARRFRANRISIFRGYARGLGRDFGKVANALKLIMVHASVDRSALASLLLKQRLLFSYTMMSLEVKLALHSFGWSAPTVDVRNLVGALDTLSAQLRALSLNAQPSLA